MCGKVPSYTDHVTELEFYHETLGTGDNDNHITQDNRSLLCSTKCLLVLLNEKPGIYNQLGSMQTLYNTNHSIL